jgi:hypothetical protein
MLTEQEDRDRARSNRTARHRAVFFMVVLLYNMLGGFTYIDAK